VATSRPSAPRGKTSLINDKDTIIFVNRRQKSGMTSKNIAAARQRDVFLAASASAAEVRGFQRMAQAGTLVRVARGVYVTAGAREEVEQRIRRAWQEIAGALVPGGVVSHLSALTAGMTADGTVTLSHPTLYGKTIGLPGLSLVLLRGPGPLPGDLPLGNTGLHWASRPRMLIENLGKKAPRRAGRDAVEAQLVAILAAAGESALNLETAVGRARVGCDAVCWQDATTPWTACPQGGATPPAHRSAAQSGA
jgi:hypothetical protein